MLTTAYPDSLPLLTQPVPMSDDAAFRLKVAPQCFDPVEGQAAPYAMHPGIASLLTEEELDENILFLDEGSFGKKECLVGGLLDVPYRELVTLVADGGVGKSLLAADLAFSVAAGSAFLGQETRPGTALYLDFEQERSTMLRRLRKLATEAKVDLPTLDRSFHYRNFTSRGETLQDVGEQVLELAARVQPDLIVLDSWASALQIDSNDEGRVNPALNVLKKFLKWGTVLTLAHLSDGGVNVPADQMKPSGNRQQRNQPRRIYGLRAKPTENYLTLGISKTNEPVERTQFKIERVDTLDGKGLKHVLLDEDGGSNGGKVGMQQEGQRLPERLEFIRDTVKTRGQVARKEMHSKLVEWGMTASTAEKALSSKQLEPIYPWVRLVPDEQDSRSKKLVWREKVILPIAENTGQTSIR